MRGEDFYGQPQCGCQCWCVLKSSRVDRFRNLTELDGDNGKARRKRKCLEEGEVLPDDSCARCLRAVRFTNGYGKLR